MKIGGKTKYIPHVIIEYLADIHAAMDPDTGHYICHYKPIGLTTIEVNGVEYPALRLGDCTTLVLDEKAVEEIINNTVPLDLNALPPEGYLGENLPLHELGSILSLVKESIQLEFRKPEDNEKILVIIIKHQEDYALILERCTSHEHKRDILQV